MSRAQSFPDNRQEFSGMSLVQRLFDPDIFCSWLAALPACCDCINRRSRDMLMEKLWSYLLPLPKNLLLQENSVIRSYIFWRSLTFVFASPSRPWESDLWQGRQGWDVPSALQRLHAAQGLQRRWVGLRPPIPGWKKKVRQWQPLHMSVTPIWRAWKCPGPCN